MMKFINSTKFPVSCLYVLFSLLATANLANAQSMRTDKTISTNHDSLVIIKPEQNNQLISGTASTSVFASKKSPCHLPPNLC